MSDYYVQCVETGEQVAGMEIREAQDYAIAESLDSGNAWEVWMPAQVRNDGQAFPAKMVARYAKGERVEVEDPDFTVSVWLEEEPGAGGD